MKILSVIPPLVQINTPYPATSFLTGFLRSRQIDAHQADYGLDLILKLLSPEGLDAIRSTLLQRREISEVGRFFLEAYPDYSKTIRMVVSFLQGKDPSIAHRISARTLLPEGPRFAALDSDDLHWAFGQMGVHDQAKHLASLYIDDLTDLIAAEVDPGFSLSRYGEKLAASQPSFQPLLDRLKQDETHPTLIDQYLELIVNESIQSHQPSILLITIPFPGCVLGALKIARFAKIRNPELKVAIGGGYVNTELRTLKDARIFDFIDAITLDDGERPLECLLEYWSGRRKRSGLLRTFLRSEKLSNAIEYCSNSTEHDIPQSQTGIPTIDGLRVGDYISMVEMLNPMHRFWSDLYWNKLMLAHGCYWHQCSFCDVNLDYIKRYEISPVQLTIERMKSLSSESGSTGFHFIDEAAPPAILKELSKNLIDQGHAFSWWGNIRFEKSFTPDLTELMSDAGCIAVSGGLEVASDRLLKKMKKGVTVDQVARVTRNFRNSKILVHAYLMYGFPTQTEQETIDSLERVRQLFKEGCLSSAFWHRFSATAHSPVGHAPEEFGIEIDRHSGTFSENDLHFRDPTGVDHDRFGYGLRKAVYNYMLGIGLEADVREWFEFPVPKAQVDQNFIHQALKKG